MEDDEYRKLAEVEDRMWYFRALHANAMDRLLPQLASRPARLLDAGCGTGGFIRRLAGVAPDIEVTGLDLSTLACHLARERCSARIVEGSVTALPFPDESFSAVTSLDVIYHLERPLDALAEYFRVLVPGGWVVINAPAYRWLWSYHDDAVHAQHRFTRGELSALVRQAGFDDPRGTYWNSIPLPLIVIKRKLLGSLGDASDVRMFPPWIERVFNAAMAVERAWMHRVGSLPAGCSVLLVARKPRV